MGKDKDGGKKRDHRTTREQILDGALVGAAAASVVVPVTLGGYRYVTRSPAEELESNRPVAVATEQAGQGELTARAAVPKIREKAAAETASEGADREKWRDTLEAPFKDELERQKWEDTLRAPFEPGKRR